MPSRSGNSGTKSAEGMARQRERNMALAREMGVVDVNKKSARLGDLLGRIVSHDWEDVAEHCVHSSDFTGKIANVSTAAKGYVQVVINVPPEYASRAMQAYYDGRLNFLWLRVYAVPAPTLMDDPDDDDGPEAA